MDLPPVALTFAAMETIDILVAGGGVAGLTATLALAEKGWRTVCVDPAPSGAGAHDTRTTAFLAPAVELLTKVGVWGGLDAEIAPLATMRLIDAGGEANEARETVDFRAEEIGEPRFGWNIPNTAIRAALTERLQSQKLAELRSGLRLDRLTRRRDHMIARLSNGDVLHARLVVGADGRNSAVRNLAGIGARRWTYGQKALVFTVSHDAPHLGVSTEIHRTGGPFTLVPMPDGDQGPRSSVVWMERSAEADRLASLPEAAFEIELNDRALGVLGRLKLISDRAAWPMLSLLADRLTAPRVALIAEAAHVVPPIGAQGLNTSLGDIRALADAGMGGDPGRPEALAIYARRWREVAARVRGVDALNRAAIAEAQPLRDLRRAGLSMIARAAPIRRAAMTLGTGRQATVKRPGTSPLDPATR